MNPKNMLRFINICALSVALSAVAPLVQAQASKSKEPIRSDRESSPSMQGMMDQCAKQCESAMRQCDAVMGRLREARDSNDPAKMRRAIDETLRMCAQMKDMMSRCTEENRMACMQMMDMMGRMHGGMMMRPDGGSSDQKKK